VHNGKYTEDGVVPDLNDFLILQSELRETKEILQRSMEEAEITNEELQSSNEELISSNENYKVLTRNCSP
jgi:hypothetical protein